jgi:hypothetical protein
MSTTADVGKNAFRQSIARGRMANRAAREALRRIIDEQPGPQTTALLLAKAGLQIGISDEVFHELEQIGHKAKNWPKEP